MRGCGGKVRVTLATKNPKMLVRGMRPEKGEVRCREVECFGWKNVKEIRGSAESRSPKGGGGC